MFSQVVYKGKFFITSVHSQGKRDASERKPRMGENAFLYIWDKVIMSAVAVHKKKAVMDVGVIFIKL